MKGASPNGTARTSVSKEKMPDNGDLTALITFLITEIRDTLNAKIDILNERISMQNDENKRLRGENDKLKDVVNEQEKLINELKTCSLTQNMRTQTTQPPTSFPTTVIPDTQKSRGLKAHNLIFTCASTDIENTDPKVFIEQILIEKFGRKPKINAVSKIDNRGQQPSIVTMDTRQQETSGATSSQSKLIVQFHSIWDVKSLLKDKIKALRESGIYISEDLYKEEAHLFYLARNLRKKNIIHTTYTEDGLIYIIEKQGATPKILKKNDPILSKLEDTNVQEKTKESIETSENIQQKETPTEQTDEPHKDTPQTSTSDSSMNVRLTRKKIQDILENGDK